MRPGRRVKGVADQDGASDEAALARGIEADGVNREGKNVESATWRRYASWFPAYSQLHFARRILISERARRPRLVGIITQADIIGDIHIQSAAAA